jgi:general L-amino acid transport system permease protein
MTSVNFLKPNKDNLNLFLVIGALFFSLGIIDFCLNNFYRQEYHWILTRIYKFFHTTNFWNDRSSFN